MKSSSVGCDHLDGEQNHTPEQCVGGTDVDTQHLQEQIKKQQEEIVVLAAKLRDRESQIYTLK